MKNKFSILLLLAMTILLTSKVHSNEIPYDIAVRTIVNEASNQGFKGMVCVGEVLRHRGSVRGFYFRSRPISRQSKVIWKLAAKAWEESAHTNYTQGADHFANVHKGNPWWVKHCVKTYEYKDHVFYKEIRHYRGHI
jgi:hypothetical protein